MTNPSGEFPTVKLSPGKLTPDEFPTSTFPSYIFSNIKSNKERYATFKYPNNCDVFYLILIMQTQKFDG